MYTPRNSIARLFNCKCIDRTFNMFDLGSNSWTFPMHPGPFPAVSDKAQDLLPCTSRRACRRVHTLRVIHLSSFQQCKLQACQVACPDWSEMQLHRPHCILDLYDHSNSLPMLHQVSTSLPMLHQVSNSLPMLHQVSNSLPMLHQVSTSGHNQ